MSAFTIRPMDESDWDSWMLIDQEAFNSDLPPHRMAQFRATVDFDRSLGAYEDDRLVGATVTLPLEMGVPGGSLPVAGVTGVAVLPTHHRRGALTGLMRRQLTDVHERGESVAALYASEAAIYGRFGYGRASDHLSFTISTSRSAFRAAPPADPGLRLRVATPADVRDVLEKVHEAAWPARPGMYRRDAARWDMVLSDETSDRAGTGSLHCVVAEDDGGPRGYLLFRVKSSWDAHDVPDSELRVGDLAALDPAAYAALWRHALDRDLCATVVASSRPVDDPLVHMLADPRRLHPTWGDDLWVRVVDVPRALPARRYSAPVDMVVEVEDVFCPWNAGRWRLTADPSGASCERTGDPADVVLPADVLGAAYLGGRALTGLTTAGLVREATPGALRRLSTALAWDPAPWCGLVF